MAGDIKRIIVLGGGTAGWITAGILARKHASNPEQQPIQISLIESADIGVVGVGEGTWPTMRKTLAQLGIAETQFIRHCGATFKQASKFVNWIHGQNDVYYHPFTEPQGFNKVDPAPYWQSFVAPGCSFSEAVSFQQFLCENNLAPKSIANKEYEVVANYGYHLDAAKFITLLRDHCVSQLGVQHICDTVEQVNVNDDGDLESLLTKANGQQHADLFVDCSGMRSKLLGETLKVPFKPCDQIFIADTALATQVPYAQPEDPIACQTIATAQSAGWIWDIGLQNRRGVGYVYSSEHCSEDQAQHTLANYIGCETIENVKKIHFKPGHREIFWKNNCVAVGLSAGFLEPLEASALMLIETSANYIAEQLPANTKIMPIVAKRFNAMMLKKWRGVIDFLKLHYVLSERPEPFWLQHRQAQSIPDSLKELLTLWRYNSPSEYDFTDNVEAFSAASYQYILYGAGFKSDFTQMSQIYKQGQAAQKQLLMTQKRIEQLQFTLPKHRELIDKVNSLGFSTI
ncbi:tryptophan halogenase family protein [Paraglaciecola arctica]|uniref:tryptophan halogenase family protein n=1 Tax=Paraglaciecola arctica TaxID=1128911 RepID=UPI001C066727|nr:tryptophan halogenase family protein [Paraglaciecola arctica]MBU3004459.1 tryptophan 7-halogenase [Paraglaciecola arctica]